MKEKILKLAEECGIKITFVCGKPDECPSDDNCCHHSVPSGRWIKDGMIETFYAKAQAQALIATCRRAHPPTDVEWLMFNNFYRQDEECKAYWPTVVKTYAVGKPNYVTEGPK